MVEMKILGDLHTDVFFLTRKLNILVCGITLYCGQPGTITIAGVHTPKEQIGFVIAPGGNQFIAGVAFYNSDVDYNPDSLHQNTDAILLGHCGRWQLLLGKKTLNPEILKRL